MTFINSRSVTAIGVIIYIITAVLVFATVTNWNSAVLGSTPLKYSTTVVAGGELSVTRIVDPIKAGCRITVEVALAAMSDLSQTYPLRSVDRVIESFRPRYVRTYTSPVPGNIPAGEYIYLAVERQYCTLAHRILLPLKIEHQPFIVNVVNFAR